MERLDSRASIGQKKLSGEPANWTPWLANVIRTVSGAQGVQRFRAAVEALSAPFGSWQAFFYENDSTDDTPGNLRVWATADARVEVRCDKLGEMAWP